MEGNPQREDGYTGIAHEILEALARTDLTGAELRCIMVVLRHTYGYHRKAAPLSLGTIAQTMGISGPRASKIVAKLSVRNIVTINPVVKGIIRQIGFNKRYKEWRTINDGVNSPKKRYYKPRGLGTINNGVNPIHYIKDNFKDNGGCSTPSSPLKGKPKKTPSKGKPKDPRIKEAFTIFSDCCFEARGFRPQFSGKKDAGAVEHALRSNGNGNPLTFDEMKDLIKWYMTTDKAKEHLTLSAAVSGATINQYRQEKANTSWMQ